MNVQLFGLPLELGVSEALALISAIWAFFSWLSSRAAAKRAQIRQDLEFKTRIEAGALAWGEEAIEVLAEAHSLAKALGVSIDAADFKTRRDAVLTRLSALVDRGRMYFPNFLDGGRGMDRHAAYQGVRLPIQDALMLVYNELDKISPMASAPRQVLDVIEAARRTFASELYRAVDARGRIELLARLEGKGRASKSSQLLNDGWDRLKPFIRDYESRHGYFWQDDHPRKDWTSKPDAPPH